MARILAYVPDLLFGSTVVEMLRSAGHDVQLVGALEHAEAADLVIVDLTADAPARLTALSTARPQHQRTLAFYSHVEAEVRRQAQEAGIDAVIPRSRMAREGAAVVERLLASPSG